MWCFSLSISHLLHIILINIWGLHIIFSFRGAEDAKETSNSDAPENNPLYTTVYVGNLAPEVRISFYNLNVGLNANIVDHSQLCGMV